MFGDFLRVGIAQTQSTIDQQTADISQMRWGSLLLDALPEERVQTRLHIGRVLRGVLVGLLEVSADTRGLQVSVNLPRKR